MLVTAFGPFGVIASPNPNPNPNLDPNANPNPSPNITLTPTLTALEVRFTVSLPAQGRNVLGADYIRVRVGLAFGLGLVG